jgi:hypothetical protein
MMTTFTDAELKLVHKLRTQPPMTVLKIRKTCPTHSVCTPLPLFRIYKIDDISFEAQWNGYHEAGPRQVFSFENSENSGTDV